MSLVNEGTILLTKAWANVAFALEGHVFHKWPCGCGLFVAGDCSLGHPCKMLEC